MARKPEQFNGQLRSLILAVLDDGPKHGYAIAREIERRSADALRFGEGAIYPCLRQLEEEGLTNSAWDTSGPGPAKKVYQLTQAGIAELDKSKKHWLAYVDSVNSVLKTRGAANAG